LSKVNGCIYIAEIFFDIINESLTLKAIVERYRELHGVYPVSFRTDKIDLTKDNKAYCRKQGIRAFPADCSRGRSTN